jgi:hypothetical protein
VNSPSSSVAILNGFDDSLLELNLYIMALDPEGVSLLSSRDPSSVAIYYLFFNLFIVFLLEVMVPLAFVMNPSLV